MRWFLRILRHKTRNFHLESQGFGNDGRDLDESEKDVTDTNNKIIIINYKLPIRLWYLQLPKVRK